MKKFAVVAASAMLGTTLLFGAGARPAFAASKVNCEAVMNEFGAGKHAKEIAKDLSISVSSVYRCKKHAREAAKASTKAMTAASAPAASAAAAMASPAAKASPAAH